MADGLVIVESPAKARTVERILGGGYSAMATMGHVRDLPRREMGVEVEKRSFRPKYRVLPDKKSVVSDLAKSSEAADVVYLATDPDREGEAISWHVIHAAKIDESKVRRVVFHEITQRAVKEAFEHPRQLDRDLIDAQQARRVLDRLVGYELSPVLWRKVRRGLSAGRVQSVALRLIADREREHQSFVPQEYWTIEAILAKEALNGSQAEFKAALRSIEGRKGGLQIPNEGEAKSITSDLDGADYRVQSVKKKQTRSRPSAPFTTSTLQQEGWRRLRMTARRTMQIAQQLYEGISLGDQGSVGLITYMRTDSTTVSGSAVAETRRYIEKEYGPDYLPKSPRLFKKKAKGAQEAHEAIRPTSIDRHPESIRQFLNGDQLRLYRLIWRRMLASQMSDAVYDSTTVDILAASRQSSSRYVFRVVGRVMRFPGYRALSVDRRSAESEDEEDEAAPLPELDDGDRLECHGLLPEQNFTEPPPRYSEATLVRAMEEQGIGRPSTYAPTIATLLDRSYVVKEQGRFVPSKLGFAVNDLLTKHFPDIMDVGFTAHIESELDEIASGERKWVPVLRSFYDPFNQSVERAMVEAERVPRENLDEDTDEVCEVCERPMVIKSGRFGRFLSCSGFPECRNSRPLLTRVGVECPKCGSDLVERQRNGKGRGSKRFYGCSSYPSCEFAVSRKPLPQTCPECSGLLVAYGRDKARCTACDFKGPVPDSPALEVAV